MEQLHKLVQFIKDAWGLAILVVALLWGILQLYDEVSAANDKLNQIPALAASVDEVNTKVTRFEARLSRYEMGEQADMSPPASFPGFEHFATDAPPGGITRVNWLPVRRLRTDCRAAKLDAFTVGHDGTTLPAVPLISAPVELTEGDHDLSYGVRLSDRIEPGRAQVYVQILYDCRDTFITLASPRLSLTVLPPIDG